MSDFAVAYTLCTQNEWKYGIIVMIVDYIPGWQLVVHNLFSEKWRKLRKTKENFITLIFLIVSPFSVPLFFAYWVLVFNKANRKTFEYLHHNARLSQLLAGSLESPLQLMLLFVLYGEGKLPLPWSEDQTIPIFIDPQGNLINLGILPGMFSFITSIIVILKGSVEIAESNSIGEKIYVCCYATCNLIYRISSFSLAILYYQQWSILIFLSILILNVTCIIRHDSSKRKGVSVVTSAIISVFTPFLSSDQPHRFQVTRKHRRIMAETKKTIQRKDLSAKMAIMTFPVLLASNLVLFFLLKYYPEFKFYSKDIILDKGTTETILCMLILPTGISSVMTTLCFCKRKIKAMDENTIDYFNPNHIIEILSRKFWLRFDSRLRYFVMSLAVLLSITMAFTTTVVIRQDNQLQNFQGSISYFLTYSYSVAI